LEGAVLDVFDVEPLTGNKILWTLPNVLITPHMAAESDPEVVVE
jgi:glyoxylate/hydroxypyruvate reductase A